MSDEGQTFDRKSIRYALGRQADLEALSADCVGLANANGGVIHLGVEDDADAPPQGQRVPADLPDRLRKRIAQLTVNVGLDLRTLQADNGGEFVEVRVLPNPQGIASTTKGVYFIRVADQTKRLLPDDLGRLWNDRGSLAWELQTSLAVPAERRDAVKTSTLCAALRASDRVKPSVKAKGDEELLAHYHLAVEGRLTNLGVLWVGRTADRAALQHAPVIQCIKYDARGQKVRKWSWDDFSRTPLDLIEAVWTEVPEWKESYELPDGLFRKTVPHYDEVVVREILANALVHRPYTTRGDIYVNLHPDRMEVHNPGLLPVGVTPTNILHTTSHRNPHLARVFHDLKLMEREGSGFDRMYEVLLSSGHPVPDVQEGDDRVVVTVSKSILNPEVIDFMGKVQQDLQPQQRESIVLGLLAQHEAMTMKEVARALGLQEPEQVDSWMGRLREWGLVVVQGRTQAARYSVAPGALRKFGFKGRTSLKGIEDHRLRELILHDLELYGAASRAEIHARIGSEIPAPRLRRMLVRLVADGVVQAVGERRWRRYRGPGDAGQRQ
ncbi:MAG: ATP-binding protein [Planctomycetota bacterium]